MFCDPWSSIFKGRVMESGPKTLLSRSWGSSAGGCFQGTPAVTVVGAHPSGWPEATENSPPGLVLEGVGPPA